MRNPIDLDSTRSLLRDGIVVDGFSNTIILVTGSPFVPMSVTRRSRF